MDSFILKKINDEKLKKNINGSDVSYDSDSSDEEVLIRTGDIPQKWYNDFDHVGYNINSIPVKKNIEDDEISQFLMKAKNKNWWRFIKDEKNNETIYISDKDLEMIKRIRNNLYANSEIKDNEYFENNIPFQIFPLSNHTFSKKRFEPSHNEKKHINRLAKMIEIGLIKPKSEKGKDIFEDLADIWNSENTNPGIYHPNRGFSMPKQDHPDHELSYNPPGEIVSKEISLRKIPKYNKLVDDQYERLNDIFQSIRLIRKKNDLKEEDILPKLPKPEELKPFPSKDNVIFKGHDNTIISLCIDDSGDYLFSGDLAGFVHIYDSKTTKILHKIHFKDNIKSIEFSSILQIITICCEESIYFLRPIFLEKRVKNDIIHSNIIPNIESKNFDSNKIYKWKTYDKNSIQKNGLLFSIHWNEGALINFQWHHKGDFFSTLSKSSLGQTQLLIHNLSSLEFFSPLSKNKGNITCFSFHPSKPHFYVCTHSNIMIYDLKQQELVRKFISNLKGIKKIHLYQSGSDFIVGTLDGQVAWFQSDLSEKPYYIMEYHQTKIKSLSIHLNFPLFASASKDGDILIYHGKIFEDFLHDPLIVPLSKLKAVYNKKANHSCNSIIFHPKKPWIYSCGGDKSIVMWS